MFKSIQILFLLLVLVLQGCSSDTVSTSSAVTSNELSTFIDEHKLNVIDSLDIQNAISVILYEGNQRSGYYMLYKDKTGIHSKEVSGVNTDSLVYLSGSATNYPFVTILLNDKLFGVASHAEVEFNDGTVVKKNFNRSKGTIIPYGQIVDGNKFYTNVNIYDSENSIIYSKKTDS